MEAKKPSHHWDGTNEDKKKWEASMRHILCVLVRVCLRVPVFQGGSDSHLPKVFSRDGVKFLRHSAVDAGLSSFPRRF